MHLPQGFPVGKNAPRRELIVDNYQFSVLSNETTHYFFEYFIFLYQKRGIDLSNIHHFR